MLLFLLALVLPQPTGAEPAAASPRPNKRARDDDEDYVYDHNAKRWENWNAKRCVTRTSTIRPVAKGFGPVIPADEKDVVTGERAMEILAVWTRNAFDYFRRHRKPAYPGAPGIEYGEPALEIPHMPRDRYYAITTDWPVLTDPSVAVRILIANSTTRAWSIAGDSYLSSLFAAGPSAEELGAAAVHTIDELTIRYAGAGMTLTRLPSGEALFTREHIVTESSMKHASFVFQEHSPDRIVATAAAWRPAIYPDETDPEASAAARAAVPES